MKNRMHARLSMNAFVYALMAVSLCVATVFASGCAASQMSDGKSGETHFLCATDADCTRHFGNDDYYCGPEKYCAPKTNGGIPHADGGDAGDAGTGGTATINGPLPGSGRLIGAGSAALTFSSTPAPGKTCTRTNPQLSFPAKDSAGVQAELNCNLSRKCSQNYFVYNNGTASPVSCSVLAAGDGYDVQLSLNVDGSASNEPSVQFGVTGTVSQTGGTVAIQETNSVAGGGGSQAGCTLTITPTHGWLEPGSIFASFECGLFRDERDVNETGCELSGRFLFEECNH
jgi:hypothetical protein